MTEQPAPDAPDSAYVDTVTATFKAFLTAAAPTNGGPAGEALKEAWARLEVALIALTLVRDGHRPSPAIPTAPAVPSVPTEPGFRMTALPDDGPTAVPDPALPVYLVGMNHDGDLEAVPATELGVARLRGVVFELAEPQLVDELIRGATLAADYTALGGTYPTAAGMVAAAVRAAFEYAIGNGLIRVVPGDQWPEWHALHPPYKPGPPEGEGD